MRRLAPSKSQFVLMIGDDGVLFVPSGVSGESQPFYVANNDRQGEAEIFSILAQHPKIPLTLFVDALAQDFRRETLPRLAPFDRPRLIRRRLQQAFPQAGITASLSLASSRTQILFAGLHESNPIFSWLKRLKENQPRRAVRIALVPVECADMLAEFLPGAEEGWTLMLSRQRTGGFRQIVTHKGELIFTRLTPPLPPEASASEVAQAIVRDIQASLGYLSRLGLTEPSQLQAVLIVPDAVQQALKAAALPIPAPRLIAPYEAAQFLRLPFLSATSENYSDVLYAGWLARKRKPRLPLMPPDMSHSRRDDAIKLWGWRAALAALLLAVGSVGYQASEPLSAFLEARQETERLAGLGQKLATVQGASVLDLGRLRQAAERRRLFEQPVPMPWAALAGLGRGVGEDMRLSKLAWRSESGKPFDETVQVNVRLIKDIPADRSRVVARFQEIAQNVKRGMPGYKVEVTRYPFPALPREALSNKATGHKKSDDGTDAELTVRRMP
ncbi:MAG: hypothetical protein SFW62_00870 [Alphaproteobacteria bacterium]|nr:hypothetical protein [Alphaproteobacteria bacterium]